MKKELGSNGYIVKERSLCPHRKEWKGREAKGFVHWVTRRRQPLALASPTNKYSNEENEIVLLELYQLWLD